MEMMNCKSCGISNPDDAKYCRNCGKQINNTYHKALQKEDDSQLNSYKSDSNSSDVAGKVFMTFIAILMFIGISLATGGIGAISVIPLGAALKSIWDSK